MVHSLPQIRDMLIPAIHSMIGTSPDKSVREADIQLNYVEDVLELAVTRRHRLATRYDLDMAGPEYGKVARFLSRRMLTFLGYDLKNTAPRQLTIARNRMAVRAKEARGLKRRKVSRMKRSRSHS